MEIQEPVSEGGSLAPVKRWLGAVILQFVIAEVVSFFCGWLPEIKFGPQLQNSGWEPYSIFITIAALILGFYLSPVILKGKGAAWTWIVGVLWLAFNFFDLAKDWSPGWSSAADRWAYAVNDLFGKTGQCSGSECLGELIVTTPCSVAVAYSAGALVFRAWKAISPTGRGLRSSR
jgi:hypothetical protein